MWGSWLPAKLALYTYNGVTPFRELYHVRLWQSANKAAHCGFKPRGDITRRYQWPKKWTCVQQKFKKNPSSYCELQKEGITERVTESYTERMQLREQTNTESSDVDTEPDKKTQIKVTKSSPGRKSVHIQWKNVKIQKHCHRYSCMAGKILTHCSQCNFTFRNVI